MKGEGEKDNGLRGTIPGHQWHNQPHTSFDMPILSSRRHAHLRYHISGTRLPSLAGCPRHDSMADLQAYISVFRVSRCIIRAWMLYASGMTLADLLPPIVSACMIQILENHRIRCNRQLRGFNRCPSAYPILLATSGMTLADLHAYIDCTCFEMYVHGCSMRPA